MEKDELTEACVAHAHLAYIFRSARDVKGTVSQGR